jgi:WD40 repeat protein
VTRLRDRLAACAVLLALLAAPLRAGEPGAALRVQIGHSGAVESIAFSPDGERILTSSTDDTGRLFDAASGLELRALDLLARRAHRAVFSHGGERAFFVWEIEDGTLLQGADAADGRSHGGGRGPAGALLSFAAARGGRIGLVLQSPGRVVVHDLEGGSFLGVGPGGTSGTASLAVAPDGDLVAEGRADGSVALWRLSSAKIERTLAPPPGVPRERGGAGAPVTALGFSSDGRRLGLRRPADAEKGSGGRVEVRDLASGAEVDSLALPDAAEGRAAFLLDLSRIALARGRRIEVLEVDGGRTLARTEPLGGAAADEVTAYVRDHCTALAASPDGRRIAAGSSSGELLVADLDAEGRLVSSRRIARRIPGLASFALAPDGRRAIAGADDGCAYVWDLAAARLLRVLRGHAAHPILGTRAVRSVAWSPEGERALTLAADGTARVWDARSGRALATLDAGRRVWHSAFRPDGRAVVAAGADGVIEVDAASGKRLGTLGRLEAPVRALHLAPDGRVLAFLGEEGVAVLPVEEGAADPRVLRDDPSANKAVTRPVASALSPDGSRLYLAEEKRVAALDAVTGARLGLYEGTGPVARLDVSRDGRRLMVGEAGGTTAWVNAETMRDSAWLFRHEGRVVGAGALGPPGEGAGGAVATAGADGVIRLYDARAKGFVVEALAGFAADAEGEHVVFTPDGLVRGSEGGPRRFLALVEGLRVLSLDQALARAFDPEEVRRRAAAAFAAPGQAESGDLPGRADLRRLLAAASAPPRVRITAPAPDSTTTSAALVVVLEAEDRGGGVAGISLALNGKLVSEETRGFKEDLARSRTAGRRALVERRLEVLLAPGPNELRALARSEAGVESAAARALVTLAAPPPSATLFIVAAGVNEYRNPRYRLGCARPDAVSFTAALEAAAARLFARVERRLLLDGEATRPAIEAAFAEVAERAKPADCLAFYFAGHGVMSEGADGAAELFLAPPDVVKLYGDPEGLEARAIPASLLRAWARRVPAQKSLFVLDACESGGALEQFALRGAAEEKALFQLARSAGTVVLAATGAEQGASEAMSLGHGVFTAALLEGLAGRADGGAVPDGKVTVKELAAYLEDRVPELTREHRGQAQYPSSFAAGQDFPLALVERGR